MDKFLISRLRSFPSPAYLAVVASCVLMAALASCSSDDDITPKPVSPSITTNDTPIGFSFDESVTRGSVEDVTNLQTHGFGVFAMMTSDKQYDSGSSESTAEGSFSGAFMTNQKVSGSTWTYSPLRYWPNEASYYVSFLAYAPYSDDYTPESTGTVTKGLCSSTSDYTEGDRTYIKYSIPTKTTEKSVALPSSTKDLLYNSNNTLNQYCYLADGSKTYTKSSGLNSNDQLKLNFKHATARIGFVVTSTKLANASNFETSSKESKYTITVNQVMLCKQTRNGADDTPGIKRRDNVTRANDETTYSGAFYSSGLLNLNPAAKDRWTMKDSVDNNNASTLVSFSFNDTEDNPKTYEGELTQSATDNSKWTWKAGDKTSTKDVKATRENSNGDVTVNAIGNSSSDYMFIIPQNFTGVGTSSETSSVEGVPAGGGPDVEDNNALVCYIKYTVTTTSTATTSEYESYGQIRKNFKAGNAYLIFINIGRMVSGTMDFSKITFTISEHDGMSTETTIGE